MYQASILSAFTLTLSYASVLSAQRLSHYLSHSNWLKWADQLMRGGIFAFVAGILLPECIEHFGWINSALALICMLACLYGLDVVYRSICRGSLAAQGPWYIYLLLLPHCCIEGFAIAPFLSQSPLNISLLGFFIGHKVIEISMIAVSTEAHALNSKTKLRLQSAFALSTPVCMLLGSYLQHSILASDLAHDVTLLVNTAVFAHLALFCQFSTCKHSKSEQKNTIQPGFMVSFVTVLSLFIFVQESSAHSIGCQHAHHHHHSEVHHHHHGENHRHP